MPTQNEVIAECDNPAKDMLKTFNYQNAMLKGAVFVCMDKKIKDLDRDNQNI